MKNIYLTPTDKPSRLFIGLIDNSNIPKLSLGILLPNNSSAQNQNIYITSDVIPKLDEWGINIKNNIIFKSKGFTPDDYDEKYCKKIILTDNKDLIKDGVQAIDDEFLEWFVKNPNCEEVEVEEKTHDEIEIELNIHGHDIGLTNTEFDEWLKNGGLLYRIIFQKEEPNHIPDFNWKSDIINKVWDIDEEPKQEL